MQRVPSRRLRFGNPGNKVFATRASGRARKKHLTFNLPTADACPRQGASDLALLIETLVFSYPASQYSTSSRTVENQEALSLGIDVSVKPPNVRFRATRKIG